MTNCSNCSHPKHIHDSLDSYYSETLEDEVLSEDSCSICGCFHFMNPVLFGEYEG